MLSTTYAAEHEQIFKELYFLKNLLYIFVNLTVRVHLTKTISQNKAPHKLRITFEALVFIYLIGYLRLNYKIEKCYSVITHING